MNHALWIAKKNQCVSLIKKISDWHGGDDPEWLKAYTDEAILVNKDNLQALLTCLWDLEAQLKYYPRKDVLHETMAKRR